MDYYGFQSELYTLKFKSKGDTSLAQRVVQLYKEVRPRFASSEYKGSNIYRPIIWPVLPHLRNHAVEMAEALKDLVLIMVSLFPSD